MASGRMRNQIVYKIKCPRRTLGGGAGNDYLYGGRGVYDDIYVFASGGGHDTINNYVAGGHGSDTLLFQNLASAAVEFTLSGANLVCTIKAAHETSQIYNWTSIDPLYKVESFKFTDKTPDVTGVNNLIK